MCSEYLYWAFYKSDNSINPHLIPFVDIFCRHYTCMEPSFVKIIGLLGWFYLIKSSAPRKAHNNHNIEPSDTNKHWIPWIQRSMTQQANENWNNIISHVHGHVLFSSDEKSKRKHIWLNTNAWEDINFS